MFTDSEWLTITDLPNQQSATISVAATGGEHTPAGPPAAVVICGAITYGKTFPDAYPEGSREFMNIVLSMFAFLRSPFIDVDYQKLPRPMRRHNGVAPADVDKVVGVVRLRQSAKDAIDAYNNESPAWRHRWWVRGHYRRQWRSVCGRSPFRRAACPALQE